MRPDAWSIGAAGLLLLALSGPLRAGAGDGAGPLLDRIEAAQQRVSDGAQPAPARRAAVDEAIEGYRALFEAAEADHPDLPVWRSRYVEFLLRTALPIRHAHAAQFVEFGIATRPQRAAFDELVREALAMMEAAADEIFFLVGQLPRRDDFEQRFVQTGRWRQLREEYERVRIPFYRAWVHHLADMMRRPRGDLVEALDWLVQLEGEGLSAEARAEVESLRARILLRLERGPEALAVLERLLEEGAATPRVQAESQMARVLVLKRLDRLEEAERRAEALTAIDGVRGRPMMLVLSHDVLYRVTGDPEVFDRMLEEPAVAPWRQAIEQFIAQRLVEEPLSDEELVEASPTRILAHVEAMLDRAGDALQDAERTDVAERAQRRRAEAAEQLQRAERTLLSLLDRPGLEAEPATRAEFELGRVLYQRGRPREAAERWVEAAQRLPGRRAAERAAVNAFLVVQALYEREEGDHELAPLYDRVQRALLETHPTAILPGGQEAQLHWHTRGAFLRESGRYEEAVEAFDRLRPDHPLYADGLYQAVLSHHALWEMAAPEQRPARARAVDGAATGAAEALRTSADGSTARSADVLLRHAQVLTETLDEKERAAALLHAYEQEHGAPPELEPFRAQVQIALRVRRGQTSEAKERFRALAATVPQEAGGLLKGVLDGVNVQIEQLRLAGEDPADLATAAVELAMWLVDWAREHRDEAELGPIQMVLIDQLLEAGHYAEATRLLEAMEEGPGGRPSLEVLHALARVHFEQEEQEQALRLIDRLLRQAPQPRPPQVWDAWRMRAVILDERYEAAAGRGDVEERQRLSEEIYTTLRRLERSDSQLGGPPHQRALRALLGKHMPR